MSNNGRNDDPAKKVNKILSGLSPAQLKKGIDMFTQMSRAGETDALKRKIESIDRAKVMKMFDELDPDTVKKKINSLDLDKVDIKKQIGKNRF